jgi:hypothetical protein
VYQPPRFSRHPQSMLTGTQHIQAAGKGGRQPGRTRGFQLIWEMLKSSKQMLLNILHTPLNTSRLLVTVATRDSFLLIFLVFHIGKTYFYDEIDICGLLIKRVLYSATGIMMNLFII